MKRRFIFSWIAVLYHQHHENISGHSLLPPGRDCLWTGSQRRDFGHYNRSIGRDHPGAAVTIVNEGTGVTAWRGPTNESGIFTVARR
jgi:hypothetical protein